MSMNKITEEAMSFFSAEIILKNLGLSFTLLILLLVIRGIVLKSLTGFKNMPMSDRRGWIVSIKTLFLFVFLIGLMVIWAKELETFAVSLVAVAAAFVIAFKETIMNLSGYFSRMSTKPFSIGDRIEVNGIRGDVVDQNLFFTHLLEIGPNQATHQYTGRSVYVPNALYLNHNIINESFIEDFTLHVFSVPLLIDANLGAHYENMLGSAQKVCQNVSNKVQSAFDAFGKKQAIEAPNVSPRVHIRYLDKDTVELVVRIPARLDHKGRMEQEIIREFNQKYIPARQAELSATTN